MATKQGDPRRGARWLAFTRWVQLSMGPRCHLCMMVSCPCGKCVRFDGVRAANTTDHLIPIVERPDLCYDLANVKPAHRCCNSKRGARRARVLDPTTRNWLLKPAGGPIAGGPPPAPTVVL